VKVIVLSDHPTIEGMVYKDTILECDKDEFESPNRHGNVRGVMGTGKIVWVPKEVLRKK